MCSQVSVWDRAFQCKHPCIPESNGIHLEAPILAETAKIQPNGQLPPPALDRWWVLPNKLSTHKHPGVRKSWRASRWSECCPLEPGVCQTPPSAKDEPDCCPGKETTAGNSPRKCWLAQSEDGKMRAESVQVFRAGEPEARWAHGNGNCGQQEKRGSWQRAGGGHSETCTDKPLSCSTESWLKLKGLHSVDYN